MRFYQGRQRHQIPAIDLENRIRVAGTRPKWTKATYPFDDAATDQYVRPGRVAGRRPWSRRPETSQRHISD